MSLALGTLVLLLIGTLLGMRAEVRGARRELTAARRRTVTDELTGLPSAEVLQERLRAELRRARRHGGDVRLVVFEARGPDALVELATEAEAVATFPAVLARLPGDRIAALIPASSSADATVQSLSALGASTPARAVRTVRCELDEPSAVVFERLTDHGGRTA